jgi:uncharacterized membrane protein
MPDMNARQSSRFFSAWDLAALAGLLALAIAYLILLPGLPDPVPTHFDAVGRANGWTPRAQLALVVFIPPLALWLVLFALGALASFLPRGGGAAAIQPMRGMMGLGMGALMIGCLLVPGRGLAALWSGLLAFFVCMALGIAFLIRAAWAEAVRTPGGAHYKGGLFYVNPDDPRLWVEKRIGYGWTLNFARPAAYGVMALLVAAIAALVLAVRAAVR